MTNTKIKTGIKIDDVIKFAYWEGKSKNKNSVSFDISDHASIKDKLLSLIPNKPYYALCGDDVYFIYALNCGSFTNIRLLNPNNYIFDTCSVATIYKNINHMDWHNSSIPYPSFIQEFSTINKESLINSISYKDRDYFIYIKNIQYKCLNVYGEDRYGLINYLGHQCFGVAFKDYVNFKADEKLGNIKMKIYIQSLLTDEHDFNNVIFKEVNFSQTTNDYHYIFKYDKS